MARVEVPVPLCNHPVGRDDDEVRRHDGRDPREAGDVLSIQRAGAEQHVVGEAFVIGADRHVRVREERLDLRGEHEQPFVAVVIERPDADRVADQQELLSCCVEHRDGEVAVQAFGETLLPDPVRGEQARGVTGGLRQSKGGKQLIPVVEPAVHGEHDTGSPDERLDLAGLFGCHP